MPNEDREELMESNYFVVEDQSVRNLREETVAKSLRDLTERSLEKVGIAEDHIVRVEEHTGNGAQLFDVVVLRRVN